MNSPKQNKDQKAQSDNEQPVSFIKLFRYANKFDILLIVLGTIGGTLNGAAYPYMTVIFGDITEKFDPRKEPDQIIKDIGMLSLDFVYLGLGALVFAYLGFSCWMTVGERLSIKFRQEYFAAILRQDITWFDKQNPNELATKVGQDIFAIQGAIGERVCTFIYTIAMLVVGLIIGFAHGWQLTLVLVATIPFLAVSAGLYTWAIQSGTKKTSSAYQQAGGLVEQALSGLRTVISLCGEQRETQSYKTALEATAQAIKKFGLLSGIFLGLMTFTNIGSYAIGFWYGSTLIGDHVVNDITNQHYKVSDVITIFFAVVIGSLQLGQAGPCLKAFSTGKLAARRVFDIIDREPLINVDKEEGQTISNFKGKFIFKDVQFSYPSRPQVEIFQKLNLELEPGKKIAFVGESGCGKSTILQLIERFYDPQNGVVEVDGINIKDVNLRWLRRQIGYVGQEPVLFATTIRENLQIANDQAKEEDIIEALKQARAYEFVVQQPHGLDTYVGVGGAQFSGGQKQRIAIARALLKKPKILLLDEATSALDKNNEAAIQKTLDEVSEGITTLIIAHRLSTIEKADKIIVIEKGLAVEQGSHQELIQKKAKYYQLHQILSGAQDQPNPPNLQQQQQSKPQMHVSIQIQSGVSQSGAKPKEGVLRSIILSKHSIINSLKLSKSGVKEDEKLKKRRKSFTKRLYALNKSERLSLVIGSLAAFLNGLIYPFFGVILAEMIVVLQNPIDPEYNDKTTLLSWMFLVLAFAGFVANWIQTWLLSHVGENQTIKLRVLVFEKLLRMHVGWHDLPQNKPGALATQLYSDTQLVNGLTSTLLGIRIQSVISLVAGLLIAFVATWTVTLVALGLTPLLIVSGILQSQLAQGFSAKTDEAYKDAGSLVVEAVTNIRTVASFGREKEILQIYGKLLENPRLKSIRKGQISGLLYGLSQFAEFGFYAAIFYIAAIFRKEQNLELKDLFTAILSLMFAAFSSGNSAQFMPDVGKANDALVRVFEIIDQPSKIDVAEQKQHKDKLKGQIEFKNVTFKYPTRETQILKNVSFKINSGQKVAIVGPSGCGKSTILQLIQRFYDTDKGEILIDGVNIKEYDLKCLRYQLGVVSQEPFLFNGTIEENIKYTKPDASDSMMKEAAKKANALDFIQNNSFDADNGNNANIDSGFKKKVGPKGTQISGGQKQRIAIARAVMKEPNLYLFDEATSALDNKNEQIVQQSLNYLIQGKTSLTVAHRLATIQDSDLILVMKEGELIEKGTYQQLINKKGLFYQLERGG